MKDIRLLGLAVVGLMIVLPPLSAQKTAKTFKSDIDKAISARDLENALAKIMYAASAVRLQKDWSIDKKIAELRAFQKLAQSGINKLQTKNKGAAARVQKQFIQGYITKSLPGLLKQKAEAQVQADEAAAQAVQEAAEAARRAEKSLRQAEGARQRAAEQVENAARLEGEKKAKQLPKKQNLQKATLMQRLTNDVLPNSIKSYSLENPVFQGDKEIRLKRLWQIAPADLKQTVQHLIFKEALVPKRGEFSEEARKALNAWVQEARTQHPGKESEYLQSAIRNIDAILNSRERVAPEIPEVVEIAARALFLARLIRESRERIMSLIGIELE